MTVKCFHDENKHSEEEMMSSNPRSPETLCWQHGSKQQTPFHTHIHTDTENAETWKTSDETYTHKETNQSNIPPGDHYHRSTCVAGKAWRVGFLGMLINISCTFQDAVCGEILIRGTEPHLLIGCSLLLSRSGLGGGAEKVLKLSDRGLEEGLEEGREPCLRRSPSSIWAWEEIWWRNGC